MAEPDKVKRCGLPDEDRAALLTLARRTATLHLSNEGTSVATPHVAGTFGGVFVTFWSKRQLRGCMGRFGRTSNIADVVRDSTVASLRDERFRDNPIRLDELDELTIELSILSDLTPTNDPLSLEPGTHGIFIRRGKSSGCFLPKVAVERGWTAEEFLSHCCTMKAGLPAGAWRDSATQVSLFTAEVFAESPGG